MDRQSITGKETDVDTEREGKETIEMEAKQRG